ncbi:MAG: hypothetical protein HRU74_07460 [Chthonomonadaceae bacterium]|nr:MAG: hypothetical protein HRU74_07460 [Chthonomonadaceae bacterium]
MLEVFVRSTLAVASRKGIEDFAPTLCVPGREHVAVIAGIPEGVDHREAIQNVIRRNSLESEELLFSLLTGAQEVTVGHWKPGGATRFAQIDLSSEKPVVEFDVPCGWWTLAPPE